MRAALPLDAVEAGLHVVVAIADGRADISLLHLPAPSKTHYAGRYRTVPHTVTFARMAADGFLTRSWPSACGQVEYGSIYVRAGVLAEVPICDACQEQLG